MTNAFDAVVAQHDLNQHPFYRAWRAGTLPREALARYAAEYAPFIATIAEGWQTLGDTAHADTERTHAAMWSRFRDALGSTAPATCEATRHLTDQARRDFADRTTALGALYAFESQQPETSRTKLDGLERHYGVTADEYFRAHAADYGERDRLAAIIERLDTPDRDVALGACERTCRAMWDALSALTPPASCA